MAESKHESNPFFSGERFSFVAADGGTELANAFAKWSPVGASGPEQVNVIEHELYHGVIGSGTDIRQYSAGELHEYCGNFEALIVEAKLLLEQGAESLDAKTHESLQQILGRFDVQGALNFVDEFQLTSIVGEARRRK